MAAAEQIEQAHEETAPMLVLNLWQKLVAIRKAIPSLSKDGECKFGDKFAYVSSNAVLGPVRAEMDKQSVLLIPRVREATLRNKHDSGDKQHLTEMWMTFTWVDADNPSDTIECPWYTQGLDTGEKGPGKGFTYAEKMFLLKFLGIPTDADDPDQGSPHNQPNQGNGQQQRQQAPPQQQAPPAPPQPAAIPADMPGPHNDAGWTQETPPTPEQLKAWWEPFGLGSAHVESLRVLAAIREKNLKGWDPDQCWAWFQQARWRLQLDPDGTTWRLRMDDVTGGE